jgi:hypothetical protein
MQNEPCLCGATDCPRCYPNSSPEPSDRALELALEEVIDTVLDYGQWPANGRARFDLYDFLLEERDPSFAWEMYVSAMSSNTQALEYRIENEIKRVKTMLVNYLSDSDIIYDLASEYAAEEEDEQ